MPALTPIPASRLGRGPFEVHIELGPSARGYPTHPSQWLPAKSIREAAEIARSHAQMGGSRNWYGGEIRRKGGRKVLAVVSYNGRVWLPAVAGRASDTEVVLSRTGQRAPH